MHLEPTMNSVFSQQLSRSFGHQSKMQQYMEQHKKDMNQQEGATSSHPLPPAPSVQISPKNIEQTSMISTSPTSSNFRIRAIFEGIGLSSKKRHNSISISTTNYEGNSNFVQEENPKSSLTRSISFEKCDKNEQATDPFL